VAAIHAGWRGLLAGVIEQTIKTLQIPGEHLLAWLGPAIGAQAFVVGAEVLQQFVAVEPQAENAFKATTNDHWLADIYLLARQRLQHCGVSAIYGGDYCTYSDKKRFFSYRRDQQTGRMAHLIWIAK
jgi:YfiH family protein